MLSNFIKTRKFLTRGDGRRGRPAGRGIYFYYGFPYFLKSGVFLVGLGLIMYKRITFTSYHTWYASIAVFTILYKAQEGLHNVLG